MSGRVAIVTGAASGIGLGVAQWFSRDGHKVAMLDVEPSALQRESDAINAAGGRTIPLVVDVADRGQVQEAYATVRERFGPIEIVIASAGISEYATFTELTLERWHRMMDVNLTGMFHCLQLAVPDMIAAKWGRIVTISSMSAQVGGPRMAHYSASKGGVTSLTKALAREYAEQGITANTIPPSIVYTGMSRKSEAAGTNPGVAAMAQLAPVKRVGMPEDIASACAWLCSDHASYVTGQEINVNGGMYS